MKSPSNQTVHLICNDELHAYFTLGRPSSSYKTKFVILVIKSIFENQNFNGISSFVENGFKTFDI